MRTSKIGVGVIFLCLWLGTVQGTFITSTLLSTFIGGFLMGKITLGTLLAVMSRLNQQPAASNTATQTQTQVQSQGQRITTKSDEVYSYYDSAIDTEVRDRFLKKLGKLDPLNCLPKVFCEISADPKTSAVLFGHDMMNLQLAANAFKAKRKQKPQKLKSKPEKTSEAKDEPEDDEEYDDDDGSSDSESEEDYSDEPYDEEAEAFKEYLQREKNYLEHKALESMVEDYDDPLSYYLILRDKKKAIHPELMHVLKDVDLSKHRSFTKTSNDAPAISKRTGTSDNYVPPYSFTKSEYSSIDEVFDNDPFFDDFDRSLKFPNSQNHVSSKIMNVGLLKRNRRSTLYGRDDDLTMGKYKLAAQVASMKDYTKCRRIFNTCPFTATEVMLMISKLNTDDVQKKTANAVASQLTLSITKTEDKEKLKNLKKTLGVLDKLDDVTTLSKRKGLPMNATASNESLEKDLLSHNDTSKVLINPEIIQEESNQNDAYNETQYKRTRRHGTPLDDKLEASPQSPEDSTFNYKYAIKSKQNSKDIEVEFQESVKETREIPNKQLNIARNYNDGYEDDEGMSPEIQDKNRTPTFSETFIDVLNTRSKQRTKPKPVHSVVKVKPQIFRRSTTTRPIRRTTPKPTRSSTKAPILHKYSEEYEDDEEDAKLIDKEIETKMSKYKDVYSKLVTLK